LHAAALINAGDKGHRRCILVSNNEVDVKTARELMKKGILPGDRKYEQHGIYGRPHVHAVRRQ